MGKRATATQLKADVATSGKIGASLGATEGYITRKEKEADTQAAWIEKQEAANAAMLQEMVAAQETAVESAPDLQAGLQAYYEGRKAGEAQLEDIACTPENIQKTLWQRVGEEISALDSLQNYNDPIKNLKEDAPSLIESWLTDERALQWMKQAEDLPPVKFALPIIKGFGLDDIPAPLIKTISSDATVRTAGRLLSSYEMSPLGIAVGTILTVGPNLYQNITNRAPFSRIAADVIIDGVGGIVTEVAAIGTGALFAMVAKPAYIVRFPAEVYYSAIWESATNRYGWREGLEQLLTPSSNPSLPAMPIEHPLAVPAPNPVPPVQLIGTPTPSATELPPSQSVQSSSTPTFPATEVEILPTQTPSPHP